MRPRTVVINAGPPAFLDPQLHQANADPSFPSPAESRAWFATMGYRGRVEAPLPGDEIDLRTGEMTEDPAMHGEFSWAEAASYVERYARRCEPVIAAAYRRADELRLPDMDAAVHEHFTAMLALSPYFNARIDLKLCLDIEGPQAGRWLIAFGRSPGVRKARDEDEYQYLCRMHSRWLKRILLEGAPWEDFFLSLRFNAVRTPDIYNDHLLGLMKFNDAASLASVERYERSLSDDTIVRTAPDGTRYEIARYCPHAGAALDHGPIDGHRLTCLNHHYVFNLDTGRCLTGNCGLRTRRLPRSA
jgi:UDP-MurNAc hydroxylase